MKRFFLILGFVLFAQFAQAAYLYWQVLPSDFQGSGIAAADSAMVVAKDSGGNRVEIIEDESFSFLPTDMLALDLSTLGDISSFSFYIELYNYNAATDMYDVVGNSETWTYQSMVDKGYIDAGMQPITPAAYWHGGTYSVPEPTSAMLVMVGMGLLALRRRKV